MSTLADLLNTNDGTPQITYVDNPPVPIVEPLEGYATVDSVMDRFPEEVYNQSRDSHLYRLVQALCGESGAGSLKNQSYIARLKNEGALLTYKNLDTFYTEHFNFPRLPIELYPPGFDPETDVLTKEEWDALQNADDHYRNRIKLFFQATRLGNSPDGMTLCAESGTGIQCDIWENYKAYYDLLSDDPLGLNFQGLTSSPHEFVVMPRLIDPDGSADAAVSYVSNLQTVPPFRVASTGLGFPAPWVANHTYAVGNVVYPTSWNGHYYRITAQSGNSGVTQPTWTIDGTPVTQGNITYLDLGTDDYYYNTAGDNTVSPTTGTFARLDPAVEHNLVQVMDELRPVGALMTIQTSNKHFVNALVTPAGDPINPVVAATTSQFQMTRFVTGRASVLWPAPDTTTGDRSVGDFIESGVEKAAPNFPTVNRTHPVIYQTIENAHAYTEEALFDPAFETDNFYGGHMPVYPRYRSEHIGPSQGDFSSIFPFLQGAPRDDLFSASKAVAAQTTPLLLESRSR